MGVLCILAPAHYCEWFTRFMTRAEMSILDLHLCSPWKTCCVSSLTPFYHSLPVLLQCYQ